jgi:hypothetical protein
MIFSSTACTRVNRSSWPITYGMGTIELVSNNWTTDSTKLDLLQWKASMAVGVQSFFERTVYGAGSVCRK